jgi:hypothetical protein
MSLFSFVTVVDSHLTDNNWLSMVTKGLLHSKSTGGLRRIGFPSQQKKDDVGYKYQDDDESAVHEVRRSVSSVSALFDIRVSKTIVLNYGLGRNMH